MSPNFSVVIPTFNRRTSLERTLAALAKQTLAPDRFEVLVVDDGSIDDTSEWLLAQRPPFALRPLRQENSGPAKARNLGVEQARGELILFLDDDVEPLPALLQEHLDSHAGDAKVAVVGPLGSLPRYPQPWVAWEQAQIEKQYRAMEQGDYPASYRQFWTGNASVARSEVLEAGGFDPMFLRAEDVELALRMKKRGVRFRFNARARTLHHARRSLRSWCAMHDSYGRLEVAIFDQDGGAVDMLSGNWARLHPATRALIVRTQTIGAHRSARAGLEGILRACKLLGLTRPAMPVCSVLANLIFWRAAVEALGPERTARVRGLAD